MSQIQKNISLKPYNTFGIDVDARQFLVVESEQELLAFLKQSENKNLPLLILGGGSNILFTQPFEGIVLKNEIQGIELIKEDEEAVYLKVGGGVNWHQFVLYTVERNWQGVENLSLIPGTVGAAPIQNIGAYGVELKDVFESLEGVDLETYEKKTFVKEDCNFGYRNSVFKNEYKGKLMITSVMVKLRKKPEFNISYGAIQQTLQDKGISELSVKAISDAVISIRESKLPDPVVIGNCGSFFKNPVVKTEVFENVKAAYPEVPSYPVTEGWVKVPAGWLIEKCGWKGHQEGNVGTYAKQALVLVNHGDASGSEAKAFALKIQASVKDKFGIEIIPEVNII